MSFELAAVGKGTEQLSYNGTLVLMFSRTLEEVLNTHEELVYRKVCHLYIKGCGR